MFKNTFFKHIIVKRQEKIQKYKNIKITYLFYCPFNRKTLIKSKQIHFYMSGATDFVKAKAKTPDIKSFYAKASLLPYS